MKTVDKFIKFKGIYREYICLVKSGNFYYTFESDAYILNYLLGYQIRDNKVGFPASGKSKVKSILNRYGLNVIEVVDDNMYYIIEATNPCIYNDILDKSKSNVMILNRMKNLISMIELKVKEEENNYFLIKEFVDEL